MSSTQILADAQMRRQVGLDFALTGDPQISMFTYNYHRHTKYAKNVEAIHFNETVDFGKTGTISIPLSSGHLLHKLRLFLRLPPLVRPEDSTYIGWTQTVGYAMIDYVEFLVDDVGICKMPGTFLEVMDYLTTTTDKQKSRDRCVGRFDNVNVVKDNALASQDLYIDLPFWFCRRLAASLPLVCLSNHVLKLRFKFRPFSELVIHDGEIEPQPMSIADAALIGEFFLIGDEEKHLIASETQRFLIEQWQYDSFIVSRGTTRNRFQLQFNRPVKELVWYFVEAESEENNDYFNFGRRTDKLQGANFITTVALHFDGKERFSKLPESFYRTVLPERYHTFSGDRNIYVLSFAESPEWGQPTGTANFSTYDNIELTFDFVSDVPECYLKVLAINFNRLVIEPNGPVTIEYMT